MVIVTTQARLSRVDPLSNGSQIELKNLTLPWLGFRSNTKYSDLLFSRYAEAKPLEHVIDY